MQYIAATGDEGRGGGNQTAAERVADLLKADEKGLDNAFGSKETAARMLGAENFIPTGKEAAEIGLVDKCVPLEELLPTAEALAESWIKQGDARLSKRSHRGRDDTAHLVAVNEQESKDLADAFLSVKFLSVQADFLASKGKTVPSMVFKALIALRPIWKNFYTPYAKE